MTDRVKGFTVVLEEDIRVDDVRPIVEAIQLIKGVADVKLIQHESGDMIVEMRVRNSIREKLGEFIQKEL